MNVLKVIVDKMPESCWDCPIKDASFIMYECGEKRKYLEGSRYYPDKRCLLEVRKNE